ncbi:MAG: hypothetical protein IJN07_00585 [Clostridia bacterium]|nr:hypothetical protein [Clostridia bacterium]
MAKGMMKMMKGIGIGMALGCMAGAVGSYYLYDNRKGIKRNMGRALRSVGDLVDDVTSFF